MAIVLMTCMVVVIKVHWLIIIHVQNYCDCRPSGFSLPERLVLLQVSCSHLLVVASPAVAFDRAKA